ncbi:MAG: hypothetical protein D6743_15980, partial [Calditrichaeota bacterium]
MRFWSFILLIALSGALFAQQKGNIAGTVTDEQGNPLPGANVFLKGTLYGAATDLQGHYIIICPPDSYLVEVAFVGYQKQTRPVQVVAGKTLRLDFTLKATTYFLGEQIVVVGYGVQKERDITGAVSSVRVEEAQKIATTQTAEAIQGLAPGVDVAHTTGAPGAAPAIKIRGAGSFNNNTPLYIVDGVPSNLSYVNPSDIEAIDIIKDASMAAIYGSRAANGVVFVKTRRGKAGALQIR